MAPQVALACIDQLPYNYLQMLKRRNFELIPVASEDMYKHGCNVQCIGSGKVVAIEKNKHIKRDRASRVLPSLISRSCTNTLFSQAS